LKFAGNKTGGDRIMRDNHQNENETGGAARMEQPPRTSESSHGRHEDRSCGRVFK
jgi:hypothetical protein